MRKVLPTLTMLLGCALQISCSQMQQQQEQDAKPEPKQEEAPPPVYLGSVHQVFASDKFALLRIIGPLPPEGTVLISHPIDASTNRMANLIVSSSQHARNNIIAADIRAGSVAKGDRVFKYRSIASTPELEEEEPQAQEALTMGGEEIDLGYVPPAVKARREKEAAENQEPKSEPDSDVPQIEETVTAEPADVPKEQEPIIRETYGLPKLEDIPDTISGWDSM